MTDGMVRLQAAKVLAKLPTQAESAKGVVLRFDFVNNHDTRVAMYVIFATALAGFIILLVQFVDLLTMDPSTHRFQKNTDYVWNVSVGGLCLVLMTAVLSVFACRVFKAHRHKKQWEAKRKRLAMLFGLEGAVQWLNLVFYVIPNIWLLFK